LACDNFKISATTGDAEVGAWAETEVTRQERPRRARERKALMVEESLNFAVLQC